MNYEEQIMSKDKYPRIFSCQMAAIVYLYYTKDAIVIINLQLFFAILAVLKIGKYLTTTHRSGEVNILKQ